MQVIETNNYILKSLTMLSYTSQGRHWNLSLSGIWRISTEAEKLRNFRNNCVLAQKAENVQQKQLTYPDTSFSNAVLFVTMFSFN